MGTAKLCVCNRTRGSLVSLEVNLVNTRREPFNALVEDLTQVSHCGLWLKPCQGVPATQRSAQLDIVYLDDRHQVLQCVERLTGVEFASSNEGATSALVLPSHSVASSQIHSGDQLIICDAATRVPTDEEDSDLSASSPKTKRESSDSEKRQCIRDHPASRSAPPIVQVEAAIERLNSYEESDSAVAEKPPLGIRILRWILYGNRTPDRRRVRRAAVPELVAYFWTGGAPQAFRIGDISPTGFYLLTDQRWMLETTILMTLQRTNSEDTRNMICVESKVVRLGPDGVGFEFVESEFVDLNTGEILPEKRTRRADLEKFLSRLNLRTGHEKQAGMR
jgi:hypothetical protein